MRRIISFLIKSLTNTGTMTRTRNGLDTEWEIDMNLDKLDKSEKFIFDWQYRLLGHFRTALIEAICQADDSNLAKLVLGFPDEVRGYINYARIPGWWEEVQIKAEKEEKDGTSSYKSK